MVALRTDVDALGRTADDRRLILLWNIASGYATRLATFGQLASHPEVARIAGESWMRALAARADVLASRARPTCTCSHEDGSCERHATPCPCAERGECLESCCCFGDTQRQPDTASVTCWCRENDAELSWQDIEDERGDRAYEEWRDEGGR